MATFNDVKEYVSVELGGVEEAPGVLTMVVELPDGRSHLVKIIDAVGGGDPWAVVMGFVSDKMRKLDTICREIILEPIGGIRVFEKQIFLADGIALADLDEAEILNQIIGIAVVADELEKKFQGGDVY